MTVTMLCFMAIPAFAEEKTLTYDERVAALKTDYGITYKAATYYYTDAKRVAFSLDVAEASLGRLGATAVSKMIKGWRDKNGSFLVKYGTDDKKTWEHSIKTGFIVVGGYHDSVSGTVTFMQYDTVFSECESKLQLLYQEILIHELAHAYDSGTLNYSGSNALSQYDKQRGITETPFRNDYHEEFANFFAFMQVYDSFNDEDRWWEDKHLPKFEIVYQIMVKDFGTGSAAVKRAAKFLGKELPEA